MRSQPTKDPKIVSLICAVRRNPSLYDYRLQEHLDNNYNDQVWQHIAHECHMANAEEAKTYWKKLHHNFIIFYRNELIRLVRANYDEQVIGPLPRELSHPTDERFGNRTWGYYSDMRFIAPYRIKGSDPELDRLIELAKPIVTSNAHIAKPLMKPKECKPTHASRSKLKATNSTTKTLTTTTGSLQDDAFVHLDVAAVDKAECSSGELCLSSFFDAMFRVTCQLPTQLQRRVRREMLQSINRAEAEAEAAASAGTDLSYGRKCT